MKVLKIWVQQIRAPFLALSVVLVLIGIAAARYDGYVHWGHSLLLMAGVIMAHVSVNLFNELSDHHTKIDFHTMRTPFSGGSGMLQAGKTSPTAVKMMAYSTLAIAGAVGAYFCFVSGWWVLLFMIVGGSAVRFYTSHLARWLAGELVAGLTLGSLVVIGVYYALSGSFTLETAWVAIPPGILTSLLLFLNEFPDAEADEAGGRRHLVIQWGKRRSAVMYVAGLVLVYLIILLGPVVVGVPLLSMMALLTIPLSVKAGMVVLKYNENSSHLLPALGMNVGIVILTDALLALGYFLS